MTAKPELIIGFPEYERQSLRLAKAVGLPGVIVDLHRFPDGESKLQLPPDLPDHVILCRSLDHPNEKLVELILAAEGLRKLGVETVSVVAPYLCYMRQDKAFHPGEVVSQQVIGHLLAKYLDNLLTIDAHLHRVHRLVDAVPVTNAINITATRPMAHFLEKHVDHPFLIGPDGESEQWVADIARHDQLDYAVATKERQGDRQVQVSLPEGAYAGRNIVLVDDVASTGKTLLAAANLLAPYQPASISVLVTHAFFVDNALDELRAAGVSEVWSCDSITHSTNVIELADVLAEQIRNGCFS